MIKAYATTTSTLTGTVRELIIATSDDAAASSALARHGVWSVVIVEPIDMGPVVVADDAFRIAAAAATAASPSATVTTLHPGSDLSQPEARALAAFAQFGSDEPAQRPVTVLSTSPDGRAMVRLDDGRTVPVNTTSLTYQPRAQPLAA